MMKRICLALVLLIGMTSAFPAYAGERAWEEGYLQADDDNKKEFV